ncbi:hypothetical protein AB0F39_04000 [Streptomyces murinus]|uniref:hypothetical protein n=1 Tax=Streptomyces murinus TaxID=33900 RepID=UPI0033D1BE29
MEGGQQQPAQPRGEFGLDLELADLPGEFECLPRERNDLGPSAPRTWSYIAYSRVRSPCPKAASAAAWRSTAVPTGTRPPHSSSRNRCRIRSGASSGVPATSRNSRAPASRTRVLPVSRGWARTSSGSRSGMVTVTAYSSSRTSGSADSAATWSRKIR